MAAAPLATADLCHSALSDKQCALCTVHDCPALRQSRINSWPTQQSSIHPVMRWCNQQMAELTVITSTSAKTSSTFSADLGRAWEITVSGALFYYPRQPHPFCQKPQKKKCMNAAFTCVAGNESWIRTKRRMPAQFTALSVPGVRY